jgi:predicted O-methyltransferase YrrM
MADTLADPRVATTLDQMFAAAANDVAVTADPGTNARELADLTAAIYMPISASGGLLLYNLVRAIRPATAVEFGTSFGISTLHLAAAVRDNGTGHVVTTEMNEHKIATARRTFAETGLDDVLTVLAGDAMETLAGLDRAVDFVLLDGWKNLCLPVLRMLEPRLPPGALVVADDVELPALRLYLEYVRDPGNGYRSVTYPVADGMEISCRL